MKTNFDKFFDSLMVSEGGYVDNPQDPGGATNMGITLHTLSNWRGRLQSKAQVKALTKDEAKKIYRKNYADVVKFDQLPSGVDIVVGDFAVNSGPDRSIRTLQEVLGVGVDGVIGTETLKAVNAANPTDVINGVSDSRLKFLRGLSTFKTFGKGWTSRVARVRSEALAVVVQADEAKSGTSLLDIILSLLSALLRRS